MKRRQRRIGQRMKEKSEKSSMLWKPREESISGKELGTLSDAAKRLNKSKTYMSVKMHKIEVIGEPRAWSGRARSTLV